MIGSDKPLSSAFVDFICIFDQGSDIMRAFIVIALLIGAVSAFDFQLPDVNVKAKASVSSSASASASASTGLGTSASVKVATPELKFEKSISLQPCADVVAAPGVKKSFSSSFSAKSSASASASASSKSSSSFNFRSNRRPCVRRQFKPRPCVTRSSVQIRSPCVTRVSGPCTYSRPCIRAGCVRAPCARRRRTFFRTARKPGSGPRQAPTCFRPTADLLQGKDLCVQMLTVRGMKWKCEPIEQKIPNEVSVLPDPCPELPAARIIERACDKVVE
ncbi:uncharacterized protein LOC120345973 [Styela clava]